MSVPSGLETSEVTLRFGEEMRKGSSPAVSDTVPASAMAETDADSMDLTLWSSVSLPVRFWGEEGTRLRREDTVEPRAVAVEVEMPSSSLLALMDPTSDNVVSRAALVRLAGLSGSSLATRHACWFTDVSDAYTPTAPHVLATNRHEEHSD